MLRIWLIEAGKLYLLLILLESALSLKFVRKKLQNKSYQVRTRNGLVQGTEDITENGFKYYSFMGIPYARPPVGDLRFRPPQKMPNWVKVLDASREGPCCAGINYTFISGVTLVGSEDCLYMNVFSPKKPNVPIENSLPVMVFIHGGALLGGCSFRKVYGPDYLVEQNIILVTLNFRISVFGFLTTKDMEAPGNWGLKDQIAGLQWIQENIKYFGGDQNRVTLVGQSAGGSLVNALLVSPKAKGLFHGAILQSGVALSIFAYSGESSQVAFDLGISLGIETNSTKELVTSLRKVDFTELNRKQLTITLLHIPNIFQTGNVFGITVEPIHVDAVLTDDPYDIMERGNFLRVPVIIGVNSLECLFVKTLLDITKHFYFILDLSPGLAVKETLGISFEQKSEIAHNIFDFYVESRWIADASKDELLLWFTDDLFWKSAQKVSSFFYKYTKTYFYLFSYEGQLGWKGLYYLLGITNERPKGVAHAEELFYLFKTKYVSNISAKDAEIRTKMTKLWTNFIKYGDPTPTREETLDNILWPSLANTSSPYLHITGNLEIIHKEFNEESFKFWENIHRQYGKKPYGWY